MVSYYLTENHDDLAGHYDNVLNVIEYPDYIIEGHGNALIALKRIGKEKFLAVVYKEIGKEDGFIITAYFTEKLKLEEETILWRKK